MRPLLARIRRHQESRSIGRAVALWFLLSGLIGAFAGGAQAAAQVEGEVIHCLSVAPDDDESAAALSCCILGCPMVSTAMLPPPAPLPPLRMVLPTTQGTSLPDHATSPQKRPVRDGPRGPPVLT